MPHKLSVKCLSEICVDFIKDNMDVWVLRRSVGMDASNSFELLPLSILERIIKHLTLNNQLSQQYLELLITPSLHKLDFSMCTPNSISELLKLASTQCPHVPTLLLGRLGFFLDCLNLLSKFTNLQVLDVSRSPSPDSLLNLLGKHCENLRQLFINDSLVSDAGIRALCVTGKVKRLQILSILNLSDPDKPIDMQDPSRVTRDGIIMALNNLPALQKLLHYSLVETLAYLHQTVARGELPADTKYTLSALSLLITSPYAKGNLSEAMSLCKTLKKLKITAAGCFNDSELSNLLPAEQLSEVSSLFISGTKREKISFGGGLAPLLRGSSIGSSLKSLVLVHLREVNISLIVKHCRHLESLILNMKNDRKYGGKDELNLEPLPNLQVLEVVDCRCSKNLLLLLKSPSLVSVILRECMGLTDHVLKSVTDVEGFHNLKHFEVISNARVSKRGMDFLMQEKNPLRVIKLEGVEKISLEDFNTWRQQIRNENWDLSLQEIEYDEFKWAIIDDEDL